MKTQAQRNEELHEENCKILKSLKEYKDICAQQKSALETAFQTIEEYKRLLAIKQENDLVETNRQLNNALENTAA